MAGAAASPAHRDDFWRSLLYFNIYRALVPVVMIAIWMFDRKILFGSTHPQLFIWSMALYAVFAGVAFVGIRSRQPDFDTQLTAHAVADALFVMLAMHASGGISSGLGLLLLASQAGAALISRGRMMLFYAAIGSLAILSEQVWRVLVLADGAPQFVQAGLLSIGYFATAFAARSLASYAVASERLAEQRGVDLASMAEVNKLIIKDMQDGVLVVDARGLISQINARAIDLLGGRGPTGRQPALIEYAPLVAEVHACWLRDPRSEPRPLRLPQPGKPGLREVGVRIVPVDGAGGNAGAAAVAASGQSVIFLEDLSRIQSQARQLKLAALGRLTANIAHEIRNPLSAINHATELLQETEATSATDARLLQIIHDNTRRIDGMVQEVLKLNRRDRVHRETVELAAYLRTFASEFCSNERIDPSVLQVEAEGTFGVQFDRSHLNQVMWNLCRNALRHGSQAAGSIRIVARHGEAGSTCVDVLDDGPGIAPEVQVHLFEPFFTTARNGTGLGLYLAREVADANEGTLEFAAGLPPTRFTLQCKAAAQADPA